jgi:hypothetical protein
MIEKSTNVNYDDEYNDNEYCDSYMQHRCDEEWMICEG